MKNLRTLTTSFLITIAPTVALSSQALGECRGADQVKHIASRTVGLTQTLIRQLGTAPKYRVLIPTASSFKNQVAQVGLASNSPSCASIQSAMRGTMSLAGSLQRGVGNVHPDYSVYNAFVQVKSSYESLGNAVNSLRQERDYDDRRGGRDGRGGGRGHGRGDGRGGRGGHGDHDRGRGGDRDHDRDGRGNGGHGHGGGHRYDRDRSQDAIGEACDRAFISSSDERLCRTYAKSASAVQACESVFISSRDELACALDAIDGATVHACDRVFISTSQELLCSRKASSSAAVNKCDDEFISSDNELACAASGASLRRIDQCLDDYYTTSDQLSCIQGF